MVFHNGSTYGYHFIIKELAQEFEGQFECLVDNLNVSVPIKKELDNGKNSTYKIKFIDSFRFMSSSLSNLADNLYDELHNIKCTDCKSYLEYIPEEGELLISNCLKCSRKHKKRFNNELINKFANTYEFSNGDINKFILLLRKGVYPYQYMDSWERFDEKLLPKKENFGSSLNM